MYCRKLFKEVMLKEAKELKIERLSYSKISTERRPRHEVEVSIVSCLHY